MHPLDLLKVKLQTSTSKPQGGLGKQIFYSLRDIYLERGIRGLYRGVNANIVGNASSWGLYFLLCVRNRTFNNFHIHILQLQYVEETHVTYG